MWHWTSLPQYRISSKPFPKQQNLDSSKLKEFAYNNFKLINTAESFPKWTENAVEKGEIACIADM